MIFSGFRDKFQKRVTSVFFQSNLRKQIIKLPKILKSVKIIHYDSLLFIRVLSRAAGRRAEAREERSRAEGAPRGRRGGKGALGAGVAPAERGAALPGADLGTTGPIRSENRIVVLLFEFFLIASPQQRCRANEIKK